MVDEVRLVFFLMADEGNMMAGQPSENRSFNALTEFHLNSEKLTEKNI